MRFIAVVLLTLLAIQPVQPQPQTERISLEFNSVTVWLNMPRAEALRRFFESDYPITVYDAVSATALSRQLAATDDDILVDFGAHEGMEVRFKNDRLIFASIDWLRSNTDDMDGVVGAFVALAGKTTSRLAGNTPCFISHEPQTTPDSRIDRVWISCGRRSLFIMNGTMNGQKIERVAERIGD
jgi:hypothetical protein